MHCAVLPTQIAMKNFQKLKRVAPIPSIKGVKIGLGYMESRKTATSVRRLAISGTRDNLLKKRRNLERGGSSDGAGVSIF